MEPDAPCPSASADMLPRGARVHKKTAKACELTSLGGKHFELFRILNDTRFPDNIDLDRLNSKRFIDTFKIVGYFF